VNILKKQLCVKGIAHKNFCLLGDRFSRDSGDFGVEVALSTIGRGPSGGSEAHGNPPVSSAPYSWTLRLKVSVPGVVRSVFQEGLDDLPVFDEADDLHGFPTLRTGQGIGLPRSSRGQAPIFWNSRAQFFRYSFELLSASRMQGTPSSLVSFRFPRETLMY